MTSWLHELFRPSRPVTHRRRWRPHLEVLEDRLTPSTFTVNALTDTVAGSGASGDLRYCINQANNNPGDDTITFNLPASSTITLNSANGPLVLSDTSGATTITGPGADQLTISGGGATQIFSVDFGVTASLSGLTIADGNAGNAVYGGGIFSLGALSVSGCTFSGNTAAGAGGGIATGNGTLTVTGCNFTGNSASGDGGGIGLGGALLTLTGCTFSDNSAAHGGGLANEGEGATVTGCAFDDNSASNSGGGIYGSDSLTMTGSTISDNSCGFNGGGGLSLNLGTDVVTNCTLTGNTSRGAGGAICTHNTNLTLTNCTLTGNRANSQGDGTPGSNTGGGLFNGYSTTLNNTIVAGNFAGSGTSPDDVSSTPGPVTGGFNLIGTGGSGGLTNTNGNQVGVADPGLAALASNGGPTQTIALLPGSPAIDAGSNALAVDAQGQPLVYDQRGPGFARIVGGTVDIGAFEVQNQGPSITVPGNQTAYENLNKAISGISVADPTSNNLTVTLQVSQGTLTLGTTTGLTVSGNGSGSVTLAGSITNLNAALASLVYRGTRDFGGNDLLSLTANDGFASTSATVAVHVESRFEQAANLQAQVTALYNAGVLTQFQANALNSALNLKGNSGDVVRVAVFLIEVTILFDFGILTQTQANALLGPGIVLLSSVIQG
jgi:predicted outer membrane repeat protein